ncbi:MAG: hypothetical protein LYZ66_01940 [Nitrososphaerales archaeon]|nr:hypothetical protein [Nitrososphaerales archaeon]
MKLAKITSIGTAVVLLVLLTTAGAVFAAGPTHSIPAPNPPAGSTLVLDLTYHVINDEDSGFVGYWALDHYTKHVQVWNTGGENHYAFIAYDGGYKTFAGALSPQNGVTETRDIAGNFNGFLEFTFTATSNTPFSGNIPTKDYGGTVSDLLLGSYGNGQTGPTNVFAWTSVYFTGFGGEVVLNFAFYYYMGNTLGWTNAASGSSGDIVP